MGDAGANSCEGAGFARFQGDTAGARTVYQQAIDSGHPDDASMAAYNLGVLLEDLGDFAGARAAYLQAIDFGHSGATTMAAQEALRDLGL